MSAPRWLDVYDGLLALLPTLAVQGNWMVYDGQPLTNDDPLNWVTVGYVTDDGAGTSELADDPSGLATNEAGSVLCHVVANAGDSDPSITRSAAFAFVGAWQRALRTDRTLGGRLPVDSTVNLSSQVLGVQNGQGSATSLLVTVTYYVTTYDGS